VTQIKGPEASAACSWAGSLQSGVGLVDSREVNGLQTIPAPAPSAKRAQPRAAAEPCGNSASPMPAPVHQPGRFVVDASPGKPRRRRFGAWLNRSRRILLALAIVWVISIFDLGFTLAEWGTKEFVELNPLAASLLSRPGNAVIVFKFAMLGIATCIVLLLRRYRVTELACWLMVAAKLYLAVRWLVYFDCVLHGYTTMFMQAPG
jgi:hypothetical protein